MEDLQIDPYHLPQETSFPRVRGKLLRGTCKLFTLFPLLFFSAPLLADYNASIPPHPYDTSSGAKNPVCAAAIQEATHWIALIDQGQYQSSWLDTGGIFQDLFAENQWLAAMEAIRLPMGYVQARQLKDCEVKESLPGGTKGYFAIVRFSTTFASRVGRTERLILMRIEYDQWRVISYSIQ